MSRFEKLGDTTAYPDPLTWERVAVLTPYQATEIARTKAPRASIGVSVNWNAGKAQNAIVDGRPHEWLNKVAVLVETAPRQAVFFHDDTFYLIQHREDRHAAWAKNPLQLEDLAKPAMESRFEPFDPIRGGLPSRVQPSDFIGILTNYAAKCPFDRDAGKYLRNYYDLVDHGRDCEPTCKELVAGLISTLKAEHPKERAIIHNIVEQAHNERLNIIRSRNHERYRQPNERCGYSLRLPTYLGYATPTG